MSKWGVLNSVVPIQEKPDQVNLVVRHTEIANTLNNRLIEIVETPNNRQKEIAETPNNGQTEEDLITNKAIKAVITEELNAEANSLYGETVMEAKQSMASKLGPLWPPEEPEPEKSLENHVLECHHEYLNVFTENEAILLLPH